MGEIGALLFMHICKIFISVLFTLTFIALVKLCNDVTSPFLYFLFSHLCFLTVKSQLETSWFFLVVFIFFTSILLRRLSYFLLLFSKTSYHPINVQSGSNLLCSATKVLHLGQSILLPSDSWSGVRDR